MEMEFSFQQDNAFFIKPRKMPVRICMDKAHVGPDKKASKG